MHVSFGDALTSGAHWLMVLVSAATVIAAFGLHYTVLRWLNDRAIHWVRDRRRRVLLTVGVTMLAHVVEIWLFGLVFAVLLEFPSMGRLNGVTDPTLLESIYFSSSTFSTLGYGDLSPEGPLAFLAGIESLAGFMLITWSASFTYLEMQRDWS